MLNVVAIPRSSVAAELTLGRRAKSTLTLGTRIGPIRGENASDVVVNDWPINGEKMGDVVVNDEPISNIVKMVWS